MVAAVSEPSTLLPPLVSETVRDKWFDFPRTLALMLLPLLTFASGVFVWVTLGRSDWKPYAGAAAIFVLSFAGLAYSLFPYVVMDRLTIWQAAAPPESQIFSLIGTLIMIPIILAYVAFSYWLFRGKTGEQGYH